MTGDAPILSAFHDSLRDAIYVFEDDTLVDANARVGEVADLPTDALLGMEIESLLSTYGTDDTVDRVMEHYRLVANGMDESARIEARLTDASGDLVPVDVRFTRYDEYVVAIVRNLAAAHERRAELETLSDQLAVLNRVLRHDIRNDMNVVDGWLDELDGHVDDTPEATTALQNVKDAVRHTSELTDQASDLAEVVTGSGDMPVHAVDLPSTIRQYVETARQKHPDAEITVDGTVPSVAVSANEMLLSVFDNLVGNAVIHSDKPTPTVTLSVEVRADEEVVVRVADNGPGIDPALRDGLFGRGEKGVDSPGTGMGLYLVDQLVSGYGGDVDVEPNDPTGSIFIVTLPVAED